MYWLLVMRSDLEAAPGDVNVVKGQTIGAAPLVALGLQRMLIESGIDLERDAVRIRRRSRRERAGGVFGVAAARLRSSRDSSTASGRMRMGAENGGAAQHRKIMLDVRRGIGPSLAFHYTMPVLPGDRSIESNADMIAAGVRAVVRAQRALKQDVGLAAQVGRALFPPQEAGLIVDVVARDLPYYDPVISEEAVARMSRFARGESNAGIGDLRGGRGDPSSCLVDLVIR